WMPYCVRNWSYLGPFYTGGDNGLLDRDHIENENDPRPRLGDIAGGREWKAFGMERDQVDLRFPLGHLSYAVTYAHVYVRSYVQGPAELRIGNSDGSRVFFNGDEVFRNDEPRRVAPDQDLSYINMRIGINTILIKLAVYDHENSFFIRITDIGNLTLDGLEYFEELPLLPAPMFMDAPVGWQNLDSVSFQWSIPEGTIGFDHFEWNVDGGRSGISVGNRLGLSGIEDGVHTFEVIPVDDMGFYGNSNATVFKIDTEYPEISEPRSRSSIVTEPVLGWDWEVLYEPISCIDHYVVTVENWLSEGSDVHYSVKEIIVTGTHFVMLDNIKDGYHYRIIVKAVSGSGLFHTMISTDPVLVDLTPPHSPWGLSLVHLSTASLSYRLTWGEPKENTENGIDRYEVWYRSIDGDWDLMRTLDGSEILVTRPLGDLFEFKVRAIDRSGHVGSFSELVSMENLAPSPSIVIPEHLFAGEPFHLSSGAIDDVDGRIVDRIWTIDGVFVSDQSYLDMTLPLGTYEVKLCVRDDLGVFGEVYSIIDVECNVEFSNGSLSDHLLEGSVLNVHLPPESIVHYSNSTVVIDNSTGEEVPSLREGLFSVLIIVIGVVMVLVLVLSSLAVALKEMRLSGIRRSNAELYWSDDTCREGETLMRRGGIDLEHVQLDKLKMTRALASRMSPRAMPAATFASTLPVRSVKPLAVPDYDLPDTDVEDDGVEFEEFEEWDVVEFINKDDVEDLGDQ
ncbi:MAG: hypothetical protein U9R75_08725, partial [Candidatus Thermoplasmatota archaeon]|nr:hypothetical protein [Candidatus Thermoplasmatota archaeon]